MNDADLIDQIAVTLGRQLSPAEQAQAAQWLAQARLLIRRRYPTLDHLDQDALAVVLVEMVASRLRNPDPVSTRSSQVSVDDGSVQQQSTYSKATGVLSVEDWMWELLAPDGSGGGAFTIRLTSAGPGYSDYRLCTRTADSVVSDEGPLW